MSSKRLCTHDDEGRRCSGTWSELPALLLWMVKDKLDIFGNKRLAAVCRHWRSASASYPGRPLQSVGDGLPWIFQLVGNDSQSSTRREFISFNHKFITDLDEFQEFSVLFSKRGWLLMQRRNSSKTRKRYSLDSLLLVNLFTRAKIKLPGVEDSASFNACSFSTTREGYPHCVVLLYNGEDGLVTLRIAYITGEDHEVSSWIDHAFHDQPQVFVGPINFFVVEQRVYRFASWGRMIITDMASNCNRQIVGSDHQGYTAELDGAIMRIESRDINFRFPKVFRYNDAASAWEQFAVRDTCWCLEYGHGFSCCFAAKEEGLKVYTLCPREIVEPGLSTKLFVHDLITKTTRTNDLPYHVAESATWINIGDSGGCFHYGHYWSEAEDLRAVIQYFSGKSRTTSAILGHRGNVVLLYASKYHDIPTVVNVSGRYNLERGIEERMGKDFFEQIRKDGFFDVKNEKGEVYYRVTEESLMDRRNTNMHEACLQIDTNCRVLTVHGSADEIIPVDDALEFDKIIPNHKLHVAEGANHGYTSHQIELASVVLPFIKGLHKGA